MSRIRYTFADIGTFTSCHIAGIKLAAVLCGRFKSSLLYRARGNEARVITIVRREYAEGKEFTSPPSLFPRYAGKKGGIGNMPGRIF